MFETCLHCLPPERYPGCHSHCSKYAEEREKLEKMKVEVAFDDAFERYIKEKRDRRHRHRSEL